MNVAAVAIPALMALVFAWAGTGMTRGDASARATAARLDIPITRYRVIGMLQLAGAVGLMAGLAWAPLGVAASVGLVVLMLGAATTHVRAHDPVAALAPAMVCLAGAAACLVLAAAN